MYLDFIHSSPSATTAQMLASQVTNMPGESFLQLPVNDFQINTGQFRVGGNIVVIWPSYEDPLTDTLEINVTVNDTLVMGYQEFLFNQDMRTEVLRALHAGKTNIPQIERIEVYNLKGQLIRELSGQVVKNPASLPDCILLVRVYTDAGTHFSFVTRAIK